MFRYRNLCSYHYFIIKKLTINEEYVHLKVSIPKSVSTRFRELVNMKHPRFEKGVLSYELEQAMRQYIASYMTTHTHIDAKVQPQIKAEQSNPNPTIYKLKQDIFKYFIDSQLYLEVPQFVPTQHLVNAIAALKGVDNRTVKKYLQLLERFGCIKKSGTHVYEFV